MDTIKKQEEKIRSLLQKNIQRIVNHDDELFSNLLEIMKEQKQWLDKLNTIQSFRITKSKLNKAIILQVRVDKITRWLTVSWRKGTKIKRKEIDPLQSALRQAIYRQIYLWKKINILNSECFICKEIKNKNIKLHVDHKEPSFIKLTKDFLENSINKNIPINFDFHYKCGRKFKKEDYLFKKRWQSYHKQNSNLQWLCQKCNLTKKKYNT